MSAIVKIMNELAVVFAPMDAKILEASKKWILERQDAIYEYKKSDEWKNTPNRIEKGLFKKLFDIAGGKTWYNVIEGRNDEMLMEFMEKNCESIAKKRNTSIAKKLEKGGVKEVVGQELAIYSDGFHGVFHVQCDNGMKKVSIESIYAGGYNIQCLHQRVLCKVK